MSRDEAASGTCNACSSSRTSWLPLADGGDVGRRAASTPNGCGC